MAARYAGPLREAIHAFKYARRRPLARPLADLLLECCPDPPASDVAAIVPVPLAAERERDRGFNQATLLAERVGSVWRLPVRARWLRRVRSTQPQSDLGAVERRANVDGAFVATSRVMGRHVLLLDDVVTTGATITACATALRAAGARVVGALAVARAV
jgi:ComF family protein